MKGKIGIHSGKKYKIISDTKQSIKEKTILLVSGWVTDFDVGFNISWSITKFIHTFYQDLFIQYNKSYKYYG